jgi:hypothetical protein
MTRCPGVDALFQFLGAPGAAVSGHAGRWSVVKNRGSACFVYCTRPVVAHITARSSPEQRFNSDPHSIEDEGSEEPKCRTEVQNRCERTLGFLRLHETRPFSEPIGNMYRPMFLVFRCPFRTMFTQSFWRVAVVPEFARTCNMKLARTNDLCSTEAFPCSKPSAPLTDSSRGRSLYHRRFLSMMVRTTNIGCRPSGMLGHGLSPYATQRGRRSGYRPRCSSTGDSPSDGLYCETFVQPVLYAGKKQQLGRDDRFPPPAPRSRKTSDVFQSVVDEGH